MLLIVSSTPGTTATAAEPTIGYDVVDLGTLGGNATFALDINDRGAVTGNSRTGATTLPLIAFRWKSGEMISLGVLPGSNAFSRGYAINNAGVIVGESDDNVPRAFRWKAGVLEDLGTLGGASAVAHGIKQSRSHRRCVVQRRRRAPVRVAPWRDARPRHHRRIGEHPGSSVGRQ